jgi:hypothetical protein
VAKRAPTDPNVAPPPPLAAPSGRRARARRETAELPVNERARTSGFWATRQPRAISAPVTVISTETPKPKSTRAPTANAKRPGTSDDFLEEVATNVIIDE